MDKKIEIVKVLPWECPDRCPCGCNCLFCQYCKKIDIQSKEVTCSYSKEEETE